MKKQIKLLCLFGMLFSFSFLHAEVKALNIEEFENLQKVGIKVIDIRKQQDIDRTGVIPGSYKLNFYKKDGTINRDKWLHSFVNLIAERQLKFALISVDGKQAQKGAHILFNEKGYKNPHYLEGGMDSWLKAGKKTDKKAYK